MRRKTGVCSGDFVQYINEVELLWVALKMSGISSWKQQVPMKRLKIENASWEKWKKRKCVKADQHGRSWGGRSKRCWQISQWWGLRSVRAANRIPSTDHCMWVEHRNSEWGHSTGNSNTKGKLWEKCSNFFFSRLNFNVSCQTTGSLKVHCIWLPPEEWLEQKKWVKLLSRT